MKWEDGVVKGLELRGFFNICFVLLSLRNCLDAKSLFWKMECYCICGVCGLCEMQAIPLFSQCFLSSSDHIHVLAVKCGSCIFRTLRLNFHSPPSFITLMPFIFRGWFTSDTDYFRDSIKLQLFPSEVE